MRRTYQILLPLLSLFLVRVELTDLWPLEEAVVVEKILDGDTVEVRQGGRRFRVRFEKLDAPELGQPYWNGRGDAGRFALDCLRGIIEEGETVTLRIKGLDMYRRVLGEIDGVSLKLIAGGCATLYPYAQFASKGEKFTYLRAQARAKRKELGIWKRGGYLQPKLWRKRSKKISRRVADRPSRR